MATLLARDGFGALGVSAIAREAGVELDLELFNTMSAAVPWLADLKPAGRFVATDLHKAGGIPAVMKVLLEAGLLHGDCMTITGKTVAQALAEVQKIMKANPPEGEDEDEHPGTVEDLYFTSFVVQ